MRLTSLLLALLTCGTACAATIYKWVDANGVVHYSDQPHPGAEKLELGTAQTYTAAPVRIPTPQPSAQQANQVRECIVTRPGVDEVFMNAWSVTVEYRVEPGLSPNDRLYVVLDGMRLSVNPQSVRFTIDPIDRGTHALALLAESATGQALCQSPPITFHVRQPSRLAPNPQNRPRF